MTTQTMPLSPIHTHPARRIWDALTGSLGANGWTGGQYSLFRAVFGLYLLAHFLHLLGWGTELFSNAGILPEASLSPLVYLFPNVLAVFDPPWFVEGLIALGAVLAVCFIVGKFDRLAAVGMWYILACLFGRNPLILNPSMPFVGWMLLAHVLLPPAPYGSLAARGRVDPGGGWRFPPLLFAAAWIVMAAAYSYSGYAKLTSPSWVSGTAMAHVLDNPLARPTFLRHWLLDLPAGLLKAATWFALLLELLFLPLALFRRVRPWLWLVMLGMHLGLIVLIDFADLSLGMVMLHLFTFNPAWIRPRLPRKVADGSPEPELMFYDGHCGLCHRMVRLLLAEDPHGRAFVFAPLQSELFQQETTPEQREALPDSVIVLTANGDLLARSAAVRYALARLGGAWRLLGLAMGMVPARVRDAVYDGIARIRYRVWGQPAEACPMMPKEMRGRFRG